MKLIILLSIVTTFLIAPIISEAKRKVPLATINPILVPSSTSIQSVDYAVRAALLEKDWVPRSYDLGTPREILATLIVANHSLTIKVAYDVKTIELSYVDSINLRYLVENGEPFIHDAYFAWTDWLVDQIKTNLEDSNFDADISEDCFRRLVEQPELLSNNEFKLSRTRLATKICSSEPLQIIVSDQRPYVLSGKKKRTFSGLRRIGYGIPITFNAKKEYTTAEATAEGLRLVLENALPNTQADGIIDDTPVSDFVKQQGYDGKLLLVELKEWKYDKPQSGFGAQSAFFYDVDVSVRNSIDGPVIASHNAAGKRIVKSIKLIKNDHAWAYEQFFNSPDVRKAITRPEADRIAKGASPKSAAGEPKQAVTIEPVKPAPEPEPSKPTTLARKCSVTQVLKMSELGLTDDQIEAACAGVN